MITILSVLHAFGPWAMPDSGVGCMDTDWLVIKS